MNNGGGNPESDLLPRTAKSSRCRCLERTRIRRHRHPGDHDPDVKHGSETGKADEGTRNGRVDRPHLSAESTGEEEEGNLEHQRKTLDERIEWPFLEPVAFALTVSIIDPPEFRRYRFSHCLPSIAMSAASMEIIRLAYMGHVMTTVSPGGPSWTSGMVGVSPGMAD